jgi:hypothetical protein
VLVLAALLYALPLVRERVDYRLDDWRTRLKYSLDPPEKVVFVPQSGASNLRGPAAQGTMEAIVAATMTAMPRTTTPSPTGAAGGALTPTPAVVIASPSPTPTQTSTPLPASVYVEGVRYEDQHGLWNYCGPANLSMALSFWDWEGDRLDTGEWLKPYGKDKNVMPYEMADFVNTQTEGLKAIVRVGGSLQLLKTLLAEGFPVLVEKGAYLRDTTGVTSWMGHYEVVTGYDDAKGVFIAQDSYLQPDLEVPYEEFENGWRSFNYTYIPIFTPEKEEQIRAVLGPDWDEAANYRRAYELASHESIALSGIDQLFAQFNRGSNMVDLQDYMGAAAAYDEYFRLYATLDIPENERPWRILWYQTGPFKAYFYAGNHYAVIDLATLTLERMVNEPTLEESYYWRGMAKAAAGDSAGAVEDFRQALKWHPGWELALQQLALLGAEP